MNRDEAYLLLTKYLKNKNLIKHSLAAEVTMRALYTRLTPEDIQNPDSQERWGITGLLHDIDYEVAQETNQLDKHGILLFANNEVELPDDIAYAIMSHNYQSTHVLPHKPMDWAITACDQLTGLLKKFGQKAFAAGADREAIRLCESKLDIPLPEFISITLNAMQSIHKDLGL